MAMSKQELWAALTPRNPDNGYLLEAVELALGIVSRDGEVPRRIYSGTDQQRAEIEFAIRRYYTVFGEELPSCPT